METIAHQLKALIVSKAVHWFDEEQRMHTGTITDLTKMGALLIETVKSEQVVKRLNEVTFDPPYTLSIKETPLATTQTTVEQYPEAHC